MGIFEDIDKKRKEMERAATAPLQVGTGSTNRGGVQGIIDDTLDAFGISPGRASTNTANERDTLRGTKKSRKEIEADTTISEVTRKELLAELDTLDSFLLREPGSSASARGVDSIMGTFGQAQEGELPKFKTRQTIQHMFDTRFDQPGRRQTVAASSNRNNRLIG